MVYVETTETQEQIHFNAFTYKHTKGKKNKPVVSAKNQAKCTKPQDNPENIPLKKMKRNHETNKYGGVVENTSASINSTTQQQTNKNNN